MTNPLRIVVADDEPDMRDYFKKILPRLGCTVVGVAANGKELVAQCLTLQPDLVITDIKMPDMDGIEAAVAIYLVKPIKQPDLEPVIALAMRRFEQFQALRQEASDLRQALDDRKTIERAKGILMKKTGLDEHDAFGRLQKLASDKNLRLVDVARMIVTTEAAYQPQ